MTAQRLLIGAAKADITPDYGTQISGDIGRYRPVEEIRDRLYARIIVMKSEDTVACLVACDMACISRNHSLDFRAQIAAAIGATPEDVIIHCVQSHSAARVGGMFDDPEGILPPELWWVRGETLAYNELFIKAVMAKVAEARDAMVPARARFARTIDGRCAFNRRFIMRDGTAKTHPGNCNEEVLHCEGPVDPEASLTLFEDDDARPIAGLLHYTCHPIHGYPHRYVSADWPGLWSEAISEKLGGCVVGCLNGACGNISPIDHTNPDYDGSTNLDLMVRRLSQTGEKLLGNLKAVNELPLRTASKTLNIPYNQPTPEATQAARRMIAEHPEPIFRDEAKESISWDWIFALRDLDKVHKLDTNPDYDFEIQVLRLGDLVIAGWPGEPFVEAQLEVKLKSPSRLVIVAHECNDECGYLPTLSAAQRGGYEAWGKLPPGTLEQVAEQTIELIAGL
jgi:neutral ceramidase